MTTTRGKRMVALAARLKGIKDPAQAYEVCVKFANDRSIAPITALKYAETMGVKTQKK